MDAIRNGNFTSSQIYRLCGSDKVANTYINEKKRERKLNGAMNIEATSHPLSWGTVMQGYVFLKHLGLKYKLELDKPKAHTSGMWVGSEDVVTIDTVGDIKCPTSRNAFCDRVEIFEQNDPEYFKKENDSEYWQLVSNAAILNKKYAESIVWMPYTGEFPDILMFIENIDDHQMQMDIQWVINAPQERLPHLPDGSEYKNINIFKFEVPQKDIDFLYERVDRAYKILNN